MKDNGYNHTLFKEVSSARQLIELENKTDPIEQILKVVYETQTSTTRQNNIVITIAILTLIASIISIFV